MEDATFELMAGEQKKVKGALALISEPVYNIEDMDPKFCMVSLSYSGCFCIRSEKLIDPARAGVVEIDGKLAPPPVIEPPISMFGQLVGIPVRQMLTEYDRDYQIIYRGAYDTDGQPLADFSFTLHTLPKIPVGGEYPEHDELVLQAARECMVLLKNDGALPLGTGATVNPFGAAAVVFRSGCLGAGKINPRYAIRLKEGIGYTSLKLNEELYDFYTNEKNVLPAAALISNAKSKNGTAVVFVSRTSSEAHEMPQGKGGYLLTDEERELIFAVCRAFEKTVVVLNTAYPIEMGWVKESGANAVLWTGLCGMAGGRALAEILEGSVSPSGKLPNTWAYAYEDYPSANNFLTKEEIVRCYGGMDVAYSQIAYEEGVFVGYRHFVQNNKPSAYLFGHGLSYTSFDFCVERAEKRDGAYIAVRVTNTGRCAGKQTAMLYADYKRADLPRKLVAFAKTRLLQAGESELIELHASESALSYYDERTACFVLEGEISLLLGGTPAEAKEVLCCCFENKIVKRSKRFLPCPIKIEGTDGAATRAFRKAETQTLPAKIPLPESEERCEELQYEGELITYPDVAAGKNSAEQFIAQMSVYELARLIVGGKTGWGVGDKGYAGSLERGGALAKYNLPEYYFSDGNNGVNVTKPNIGFPTSNAMCATWNTRLMQAEGEAIAREARGMGLQCILAPAMNIQRNPLCGRHSEYFSEDPFLAGVMAGHQVKGLEEAGAAASVKHLFANGCELMRNTSNSLMSERTAREIYLRAFEYAFEVHMPRTVMTSYNAVNGIYPADNAALLYGWLREECGFEGFVMTDWNGYGDEGIPAIVKAGVGWVAPGSPDDSLVLPLVQAAEAGEITKALLQRRAVQLIRVILATA